MEDANAAAEHILMHTEHILMQTEHIHIHTEHILMLMYTQVATMEDTKALADGDPGNCSIR